jgi:hypothetical protein
VLAHNDALELYGTGTSDFTGITHVAGGGTGGGASLSISDTPPASPVNGQLWWESKTGILWLYYTDPNTSQWVAVGGIAAPVPVPPSGVVQHVYAESIATPNTSAVATAGDVVPQQTDGMQVLTVTITPKNSTNKLQINAICQVAASTAVTGWLALFQDSTAAALASIYFSTFGAGYALPIVFNFEMTAGTTSATTFKIRAAPTQAATLSVNTNMSVRLGGGSQRTTLTVTELAS